MIVVTTRKDGPVIFEKVIPFPSASVAESAWSRVAFSSTVMSDGCASTGGWFTSVTVIEKVWESDKPLALTVTDASNEPEVPSGGAR